MSSKSGEILIKFFWSIGKKVAGHVTGVEISDGVDFALAPISMTSNKLSLKKRSNRDFLNKTGENPIKAGILFCRISVNFNRKPAK